LVIALEEDEYAGIPIYFSTNYDKNTHKRPRIHIEYENPNIETIIDNSEIL
jgi:hypothetical protein